MRTFFLFLFFVYSSVYGAPLRVAICGHSEHECAARDDALNSTFGKPDSSVQPGASGSLVEVTNGLESEKVPVSSSPSLAVPPPSAPSTASVVNTYSINDSTCSVSGASSVGAACSSWGTCKAPSFSPAANFTMRPPVGNYCSYSLGGTNYDGASSGIQAVPASSCPSGYQAASGSCSLTNPNAVTSDSSLDFSRSGEVLSVPASGDVDTSIFLDNESVGKIVSGSYQRSGYSPSSNPSHLEVKPVAGGGSFVVYTESAGGVVRQTTYQLNSSGGVQSVQSSTASGYLIPNEGAGTATLGGGVSNPGTGGSSGTNSGLGSIGSSVTFPSDYARANEAGTAAASITPKLDKLHDDLTDPGTPNTDPTVPENGQYKDFANTFSGLTGWSMPGHSSQCPTASFVSPWSTSYTFDAHCQLITDHWAVLQTAMTVVWTLAALFIVLKA